MLTGYKSLLFVLFAAANNCWGMEDQNEIGTDLSQGPGVPLQGGLIRQRIDDLKMKTIQYNKEADEIEKALAESEARKKLRAQRRLERLTTNAPEGFSSVQDTHHNSNMFFSQYLSCEKVFLAFIGLMFVLKKVFNYYVKDGETPSK